MNDVYQFLKSLNIDTSIVVATSGGPDSMCLLSILSEFGKNNNIPVICAHVHHNLRKESDFEAEMLKKYCLQNKIIFEFYKIEKYPQNKFNEAVARNIRYRYFEKVLQKYQSKFLFTAHHGDDLIETILMRISHGSTIKGYSGIQKTSSNQEYQIIRPLLDFTKTDIEQYLKENNIEYAIDKTNSSDKYTRNRYRKYILPVLKKENINIHHKFLQFSDELIDANDYIEQESLRISKKIVMDGKLNVNKFNKKHIVLKKHIMRKILFDNYKENIGEITNHHLDNIINMCQLNKNCEIDLPLNFIGKIEYGYFTITAKQTKTKDYRIKLRDKTILSNGGCIFKKSFKGTILPKTNYQMYLNSKEIKLPLYVRNRQKGDKIFIKNMLQSKSIKDIFINEKIAKSQRENWPIVTDCNDKIIWIPGIKKSNKDCVNAKDCDIILEYYLERN